MLLSVFSVLLAVASASSDECKFEEKSDWFTSTTLQRQPLRYSRDDFCIIQSSSSSRAGAVEETCDIPMPKRGHSDTSLCSSKTQMFPLDRAHDDSYVIKRARRPSSPEPVSDNAPFILDMIPVFSHGSNDIVTKRPGFNSPTGQIMHKRDSKTEAKKRRQRILRAISRDIAPSGNSDHSLIGKMSR